MEHFTIYPETPAARIPQALLDNFEMPDGSLLDISATTGPAIRHIKRYVNNARKES